MGRGRRNYEQVTTNPEESAPESTAVVGDDANQRRRNNGNLHSAEVALLQEPQGVPVSDAESVSVVGEEDEGELITVVILDVAQKKFPVTLSPNSTVQRLKAKGHAVHKISPDRQRLIFQGRMLCDEKTLAEEKIADKMIVHLFPKPRVLIQDAAGKSMSRGNSTAGETTDTNAREGDEEEGGARVPTIIMNADEAQQRSQILVLGSSDYLEASNNVKLFSFMLLIISSIELINLLALALGVPQEDPNSSYNNNYDSGDDDIFPSEDGGGMNNNTVTPGGSHEMAEWNMGNTFDFIISAMGVYVAIVGLKATTLNTLRLARTYLTGTFLTGIGWCLFNYVMTYKLDKEMAENHEESRDGMPPMSDDDLAWQALTVMVLPCMVWMLCCLRAWQFQYLLREAEQEAEDRIRSELANITGDSNGNPGDEGTLPAEAGTMA
uniref:Ubiquitin-like domain-containing protein n=1 Tax=Amphora coffeiformis TaxID=265554 RepID=A0A7S3KY54_9STRA|mmetsp:Transcript_13439/g.25573  ORF Transcript_13439/g.25573 Transcript_13439/m.25573 type:complete len:437 (-) Transcript_13439:138-1448(-)